MGLTGGIGSGKSTVAARLRQLGATVIDADQVAREIVAKGSVGLAAVVEEFGEDILTPSGDLDRPRLAGIVFPDPDALRRLEAITNPAIWARTAELFAEAERADPEGVLVHDMPLLVERGMTGEYHLVLCVMADAETRVRRLVESRGLDEADARHRIAVQATDEQRRAAADVLLDNEGSEAELIAQVNALWESRIQPFADNLRAGHRSRLLVPTMTPPDSSWPDQAARLMARIRHSVGEAAVAVEHIGSTAVPGLAAKDVVDLQVGVESLASANLDAFAAGMTRAGFVLVPENTHDNAKDGTVWAKRFYGNADPGRVTHVHVREIGSPGWDWAIAFRDWLRADEAVRDEYGEVKAGLAARHTESSPYADAKEPWFDTAHPRLQAWVEAGRPRR